MPDVSPTATTTPGLAAALSGTPQTSSFMQALQGFKKFLEAKPASASNDKKYQKAFMDAGIPESDTGVGQ